MHTFRIPEGPGRFPEEKPEGKQATHKTRIPEAPGSTAGRTSGRQQARARVVSAFLFGPALLRLKLHSSVRPCFEVLCEVKALALALAVAVAVAVALAVALAVAVAVRPTERTMRKARNGRGTS